MEGIALLGIIIAIVIYFLPTIVAHNRCHNNAGAITVLNLLLGWTVLGWIAAFIWAFVNQEERSN